MPSVVAEPLFHLLIDAFPPNRAYAPDAFGGEPMPPLVAHFLKHLLERRLRYEAEHLDIPPSEWLDHGHADVQHARRALVEALSRHGHFPTPTWETNLGEAVHRVAAYLVRPIATLGAFVFQDQEPAVPADVVAWRLGYFGAYAYLPETVRLYVEQKQLREVDQALFDRVLRHVDRRMTQEYDAAQWVRLLAPLFDLARRARLGADGDVPLALLEAFFEDKQAEALAGRLRAAREHRGVEALDEDGLLRLLETPKAPAREVAVQPATAAMPAAAEAVQGPMPRWKQFQQRRVSTPTTPQPAPRGFAPTPDEQPATQEAVPRWQQFRPDAEPNGGAPEEPAPPRGAAPHLDALEHAVLGETGALYRDLFVKHLFAGSPDAYEQVLHRLQGASGWPDASKIIAEAVFRKHQVNIYSDPAILFTDAVEARYLEREA